MENRIIPAFADLPTSSGSPRTIVERLLLDREVFASLEPYFNNGGVCGHKVMDLANAVNIIKAADKKHELAAYENINDFKLGNVLKNVLRSRYHLNNKWKIDGLNPKVAAQLSDKSAAAE